ncbi:AraC family transcriptional regulator [Parabacteroides distasonis]|uniref:AraC family transcriptional regulator n=1 Tax=Parabacteroides distasonis TaxID=823 RepID=UPI001C37F8D6|nr:AraC family transcriptional regulator [Parabacteroides distasonis]MBV4226270.1 AraC family transcriptional regulator [Parabacteroides distasonis]
MVHIELSSRGRDTIALEMPDISYFSTNRSGGLEENCWEAENKLLTYRISDFRCRDFNVTRYQIYCKEDCCMRSLNVGNSFMGLSVVRQGIVECFLSETRDKRIWRKGYTNMIVSSGIKEERNLFRKGDTFGMTSILVSPDFFQHLSERYTEYFGSAYLRFGRGETFFIAPKNLSIPIALSVALNDLEVSQMMGNASPMYLEAKVTECLSLFMRETEGKEPVNAKIVGFSDRDKIYQARDIICSEYLNPPSLHDLALRVGTNECTLKAGVKEAFRTTVFNYLFDYRMNIAIHYLLDTNKSIGEVAGLVGYEHQAHFCTAFKRKFNVTPSEYRLKA